MKSYRIKDYKESKEFIKKYMTNKREYAFIHYACQSFYEAQCENSPRIVAICILFAGNNQVFVFSLASLAEREGIDLSQADNKVIDDLENKMLTEFYGFLKQEKNTKSIKYWLHWNMKDQNYGFEAISQRYCKLNRRKKAPYQIDNEARVNISAVLSQRYGDNYAPHPRLQNILEMNNIKPMNLLNGKEEATAFDNKEYLAIDRSVQAKVHAFSEVLNRVGNDELKTNSRPLKDIYGISISGILLYLKENVIFGILSSAVGGIIINYLYDLIFK